MALKAPNSQSLAGGKSGSRTLASRGEMAMNYSLKRLRDYKIGAMDDHFGELYDIFFEEATWTVRYFVADTGGWLFGRKVLVAPACVGAMDDSKSLISVSLAKDQIKESPEISADPPISRDQ